MIYESKSPEETEKIARKLLMLPKEGSAKKALVIALEGELGAGKTTFVRGLAEALNIKAKIKSPTFTLIKSYQLQATSYKFLYHIDCYRLKDHLDLDSLGIKEILDNPENMVLVEWSDRVKKILPGKYIKIHIDHIDETTRKIHIDVPWES